MEAVEAKRADLGKALDERRMQVLELIKGGMSQSAVSRRMGLALYHVHDDVTWLRKQGLLDPIPRPAPLTKRPPEPPSVALVSGFTIAPVERLTVCVVRCPKCGAPIQVAPDKLR